ncbi:NADH dehydrogenase subunit [Bacillus carboniphilus]|uniref:NADH dehydrogenase subunit n=1 Tax=Bacillus carboniphilus TaxID=86663 RepID=A0ABY9JVX0_9BACI|nr:NADH dehydrogenase subunit [Bacillus carboniphilus]WLR42643.1 NADH dehydrogenase subunit [Bacillus carboniphilus]
MLSTKSEQFLMELRMYLIQKGKKDEDINEIVEELEVHLTEAEKRGESVDDIIGKSRKQYIKSIEQELSTDKEGLLVLIPAFISAIIAFISLGPALKGEFKISQNMLIFGSLPLFLTIGLWTVTFFKGAPKTYPSTKKTLLLSFTLFLFTTGLWVGFFLWIKQQINTNYFVATTTQNYMIAAICILILILWSIYVKSKTTIFLVFILNIDVLLEMMIPPHINEDPQYITIVAIICVIITMIGIVYLYKKAKRDTDSMI